MWYTFLLLVLASLAHARVHYIKLRDVDLAGSLAGGIETDPITFALNGFPITLAGAGEGDVTGAVKVHTPASTSLVGPIPHKGKKRDHFDVIEIIEPPKTKVKWDHIGTPYW